MYIFFTFFYFFLFIIIIIIIIIILCSRISLIALLIDWLIDWLTYWLTVPWYCLAFWTYTMIFFFFLICNVHSFIHPFINSFSYQCVTICFWTSAWYVLWFNINVMMCYSLMSYPNTIKCEHDSHLAPLF